MSVELLVCRCLRLLPAMGRQRQPSHGETRAGVQIVSVVLAALVNLAGPTSAWAVDVFGTNSGVPATPAAAILAANTGSPCEFGPPGAPLRLEEAVDRALCENPKTREAWANVKVQAAGVGVAKAAYLPTVSGTWQDVRDDQVTNVTGYPALSSANRSTVQNGSVSLNWVLYDFGGRKAALDNARELLAAARANQDATLEDIFSTVATDYYAAQAAAGKLTAAEETERTAHDSFAAASVRVSKGVAAITDQLQAQTSYAQATYNRAKAEGDLQTSLGTLASDMSLNPSEHIVLPAVGDGVTPDRDFTESVEELIDEAERTHPSVAAARAQLDAAIAKEQETRAEGLPSISFVTKYSHNNQPASLGLGEPQFPATGHDWYFGIQVQIPLFEGFGRTYQVRQAHAQVEVQQYTLDEARQQVGLDVWKSYQSLQTDTQNLQNTASLLQIAQQSFDAAKHRYNSGVGNILELLNAQSSLSEANRQRIQALTDWRAARLQLAAKIGRLDITGLRRVDGD
ncbi:TolC family protein [Paraburkholderia phenazinium]|uniref:Protein CyaE n=1 Tax=Paraburkholderia phenazinium TaxID=60549 RepID=A0A1G7U666_9BURK|nr:TolC family protein [Paraburkholderia phenazinium]SDG42943.1 outer membrane protein [Paraburkholderia phenazinium]